MHVFFHTRHLSKGKIESHLAKTLSLCPTQTIIFFNKIIKGDKTWCFACDPKTKQQSSEWDGETSPELKKLEFQRTRIKTMLIIFFNSQGVVHKEFVINAEFYKGLMFCLRKRIQRVRPAAFCSRDFFFLHDNAPAHKSASVCQFVTQKKKLQPHITPRTLQIYLCQNIFCSTRWK